MLDQETKAEVVLTPFLEEVRRRAEERGFKVKVDADDRGGPYLYIVVPEAGSVFAVSPGHHILTADAQNLSPEHLVERARRVAEVARILLAVDSKS